MGVGINSATAAFDVGGACNDPAIAAALAALAEQVVDFAEMSRNKWHRQNRIEPILVWSAICASGTSSDRSGVAMEP
jgi:hypothetical protein